MAILSDVTGNLEAMKGLHSSLLSLGEGATSEDFIMTIDHDATILRFLVQTTQIPELGREMIETFGPNGVQFKQQGRYKNALDLSITFKEVVKAEVYTKLRKLVVNKTYFDCTLELASEVDLRGLILNMTDCWIEMEAADLSVEDAAVIKPSGTIHANWVNWLDASMLGKS